MLDIFADTITRTFTIAVFVFVVMLLVDYVNVLTRGGLSTVMKRGRFRQYGSAALLGATPGCLGAFMTVSFYIRGLVSFGATVGCMVATSGDESLVMLASFPGKALILFGVLFLIGVIVAWFADKAAPVLRLRCIDGCPAGVLHDEEECRVLLPSEVWRQLRAISLDRAVILLVLLGAIVAGATGLLEEGWEATVTVVTASIGWVLVLTVPNHYLRDHIVGHIIKEHLGKVVAWTFGALLVVGIGLKYLDLEFFVERHTLLWLVLAALVGLIPQSGPHLIFVTMFADGVIPFSILLTNSIVQEGHALLPLLSHSVRDALAIKGLKLVLALVIGFLLHAVRL